MCGGDRETWSPKILLRIALRYGATLRRRTTYIEQSFQYAILYYMQYKQASLHIADQRAVPLLAVGYGNVIECFFWKHKSVLQAKTLPHAFQERQFVYVPHIVHIQQLHAVNTTFVEGL